MRLLDRLFRRGRVPLEICSVPATAANSPAEPVTRTLARSLLLSHFLQPVNPDCVSGFGYLEADLGEGYGSTIQGFIRDGLLVPYSVTPGDLSGIQSIFGIGELKEMLRQRGLDLSGRKKEDLVRRLLASDFAGIAAIVSARRYGSTHGLMQCSASGTALANRYGQHRQAMESAVEAALREGKIENATRIYGAFEQERPRYSWERGDTIRPNVPMIACSKNEILTALTATPTALLPYPEAEIREARIQAAMALLGIKRVPRFTPEMKAVNTLIVYAQLHRDTESWLRSGVVAGIIVQCSNDGPCEECKKMEGKVWPIGAVPELPNPACTSPGGCRCALVPKLPD
jgi:hypothetical protein